MATITLRPNGDNGIGSGWQTQSGGTSNLYQTIDEVDVHSPNTSDYCGSGVSNAAYWITFDDCPSNLDTVTQCVVRLVTAKTSTKGDNHYIHSCQLFKSDKTTAVDSDLVGGISSTTTPTLSSFTRSSLIYGDKTTWDGINLVLRINNASGGGTGNVYCVQLDLTYDEVPSGDTFDEVATGGATGGGTASIFAIYSPPSIGGVEAGGEAFASDGNSEIGTGGTVLGGSSSLSKLISLTASGGASASGTSIVQHLHAFGGTVAGGSATVAHYLPCKGQIFIPTPSLYELVSAAWTSFDEDFEVHLYTAAEDTIETEADFTTWNYFIKEKEDFFVSFGIEAGIVNLDAGTSHEYAIEWDEEEWGEEVHILGYAVVGETSRRVYWVNHHGLRLISATNSSLFNVRLPFRRQEVE